MGLFDFFKKKKTESKMNELLASIMKQVFPNGREQIVSIAQDLYRTFNGKYPKSALASSLAYCGSLLVTSNDKSSKRIVDMGMLMKPDNLYSKQDAITIYKTVVKTMFVSKFGIDNELAVNAFYESLGNLSDDGSDVKNKRIIGSYGDYGITTSNPVPISGVNKSYNFLDSLLTSNGEQVKYNRLGTFGSDVTDKIIDGYAMSTVSGRELGTIYICPYCQVDNPDAPVGFKLK